MSVRRSSSVSLKSRWMTSPDKWGTRHRPQMPARHPTISLTSLRCSASATLSPFMTWMVRPDFSSLTVGLEHICGRGETLVVDQPFWKPAGCADIRIQESSWTAAVVVGIVGLARDHIGKFKTVGGVSTVVMENGMPAGDERLQLIKKRCASGIPGADVQLKNGRCILCNTGIIDIIGVIPMPPAIRMVLRASRHNGKRFLGSETQSSSPCCNSSTTSFEPPFPL
jgi:hypothetical protein